MYDKTPKCDQCMPEIMEENADVISVYMKVSSQHIMGFSGPVDLNFLSVKFIMDLLGIKNQKEVFERVHNLYVLRLNRYYDKIDLKREDEKYR